MKKYNCPSCGADVLFRSTVSVYAVCQFCRSIVVRRDVDVESIGTMAALPEDMSPFQIGTEGTYRQQHFVIIGRMKIGWKDGVWNEWFFIADDGRKGWLAEAQGCYGISFEFDDPLLPELEDALEDFCTRFEQLKPISGANKKNDTSAPHHSLSSYITDEIKKISHAIGCDSCSELKLGSYMILNNQRYKVMDIKRATCIGSEGELPFAAPRGREILSVDLLGGNGEFAGIEVHKGKRRIYLGHYLEWDDLHCRNLRPLEGW